MCAHWIKCSAPVFGRIRYSEFVCYRRTIHNQKERRSYLQSGSVDFLFKSQNATTYYRHLCLPAFRRFRHNTCSLRMTSFNSRNRIVHSRIYYSPTTPHLPQITVWRGKSTHTLTQPSGRMRYRVTNDDDGKIWYERGWRLCIVVDSYKW